MFKLKHKRFNDRNYSLWNHTVYAYDYDKYRIEIRIYENKITMDLTKKIFEKLIDDAFNVIELNKLLWLEKFLTLTNNNNWFEKFNCVTTINEKEEEMEKIITSLNLKLSEQTKIDYYKIHYTLTNILNGT